MIEDLKKLAQILKEKSVSTIYVKALRPNDNSKNQIYFAGNVDTLNILPLGELKIDESKKAGAVTARYKADLDFYWIDDSGNEFRAPHAKIIYYPDYPELRFSGFLQGAKWTPDNISKRTEEPGRLLFLGVSNDKKLFGHVASADTSLSRSFNAYEPKENVGVFIRLISESIIGEIHKSSKDLLIERLREIHLKGWILSKRLNNKGLIMPCDSPQCGGYTLEAELGIIPNGDPNPDFLGWEIKQFAVRKFSLLDSSRITLMTPEPNGGYYKDKGANAFVRKYGYPDTKGIANRMNFGGIYKVNHTTKISGLKTVIMGYDHQSKKITNPSGSIVFVDSKGNEAASWSFEKLLDHWVRKHTNACYVPSLKATDDPKRYLYGSKIFLYQDTDFIFFLDQLWKQNIFLDPALKVFSTVADGRNKMRNQFRVLSKNLRFLYKKVDIIDLSINSQA